MPTAAVNDIEICYETSGDASGPPVLLIAGLGVQLIGWETDFLTQLEAAGLHLIRFDNRDVGFSTAFDGGLGDPGVVLEAVMAGHEPALAYTLADMAADAVGLLDHLGYDSAHVVGVSMGGYIAQAVALMYPERVRSLSSLMSSTGNGDVGQPSPEALGGLLSAPPADDRESRTVHGLGVSKIWASPDHYDVDRLREMYESSWDRVGGPQSEHQGRQFCALIASPPRDELLAMIEVPTLVVHGTADTLISPDGGERTAACIAGSELVLIEGMGHDMPPAFTPTITGAMIKLIERTERADAER